MRIRALTLATALLLTPAATLAQDFAAAAPPPGGDALSFVEGAVPPLEGGVSIASATVRWFGSPELTTRALAARGAWRASRWALGLSRTGTVELGWDAAAAALGVAHGDRAAALRACVRRGPGAETGLEVGLGARSAIAGPLELWASAPQLWTDGAAPPLERHLELGVLWRADVMRAWLARAAAPAGRDGTAADHAAGVALQGRGLTAWIALRDHPARGGYGLAAGRAGWSVAVAIENHPVLSETVRLAMGWASRGATGAP